MKLNSTLQTTALFAGLLLMPLTAFAQSNPPAAAHSQTATSSPDMVEQHITALRNQLKITPAEQPQWDQFAQVMRSNAADMNQTFQQRGAKLASMNAAEDMQSYADLTAQHAQAMQKLATAFQNLYAVMPASQKATADAVFRARDGHAKS